MVEPGSGKRLSISSVPGSGKRLRLSAKEPPTAFDRQGILRNKLRDALRGGSSESGESEVAAVVRVATEWQREELLFDEGLPPALDFLSSMGKTPGEVFEQLLDELKHELAGALRNGEPTEVQKVLKEMRAQCGSLTLAKVGLSTLHLIQEAEAYRPSASGEMKQALSMLEHKVLQTIAQSPKDLAQLPRALQLRVWEVNEQLFLPQVHKELVTFVERRRKMVPKSPFHELIEEVKPLLEITAGRNFSVHHLFCYLDHLNAKASVPGGAAPLVDRHTGRPVSHGMEPFFASLRRSLLVVAVEGQALKKSVVGSWEITAMTGVRPVKYLVEFFDGPGGLLHGRSGLKGVEHVEAQLEGDRLTFKQMRQDGKVYECVCDVAKDQLRLMNGRWASRSAKVEGKMIEQEVPITQGSFTARRLGRVPFVDAQYWEWDPLTQFALELGRFQAQRGQGWRSLQAALDGFSPAERPRVEKRLSQLLADPFALQVIVDELLKSSWSTRPNHFSEEACFWTMLLFAGAQAGLGDGVRLDGYWDEKTLEDLGIRTDHLQSALRTFAAKDFSESAFTTSMQALREGARRVDDSEAAVRCFRLLASVLASKAMAARGIEQLAALLPLAQEWRGRRRHQQVDWMDQLLTDWLVNAGTALGDYCTKNVRSHALEYITVLAQEDALIHYKLATFMAHVFTPWHSAREELKFVGKALKEGAYVTPNYDWWEDIGRTYMPIIMIKPYLHQVYKESPLGVRVPLKPPSDPEPPVPPCWEDSQLLEQRRHLEAPDAILMAQITQTLHHFCKAQMAASCQSSMCGAAAQAVDLLIESYQGLPRVCHQVACWLAQLSPTLGKLPDGRKTLRDYLSKRIIANFTPKLADRLLERRGTQPPWLDAFIRVEEWRQVIYSLVKGCQGRSSSFLSGVLLRIDEAIRQERLHDDELLLKPSVSAESFELYMRNVKILLRGVFDAAACDECVTEPALKHFCQMACHSRHTYLYTQAVIDQLIRLCPGQRTCLGYIREAMTKAGNAKDPMVVRINLRLSTVGQYRQLAALLQSCCRMGAPVRFSKQEVLELSAILDELVQAHQETPQEPLKVLKAIRSSPVEDAVEKDEESGTEVASEIESWAGEAPKSALTGPVAAQGKRTEAKRKAAHPEEVDHSERVSEDSADASSKSNAQAGVQKTDTERTASIFGMNPPSQRGAEMLHAAFDPNEGLAGVFDTLRSPIFFEKLLRAFVDPSEGLDLNPSERVPYANMLALICNDGVLLRGQAHALEAVNTTARELVACHQVVHDPQSSWMHKLGEMMKLQTTPLGTAVGLRWLQHVLLNASSKQLLMRLSQPLVFHFLLSAVDTSKQPKRGLQILQHALERLKASKEGSDDEALQGEDLAGDEAQLVAAPSVMRTKALKCISGVLLYIAQKYKMEVAVLDLVRETIHCWEPQAVVSFTDLVVKNAKRPYSKRFNWSLILLFASPAFMTGCTHEHRSMLDRMYRSLWTTPDGPFTTEVPLSQRDRCIEAKEALATLERFLALKPSPSPGDKTPKVKRLRLS